MVGAEGPQSIQSLNTARTATSMYCHVWYSHHSKLVLFYATLLPLPIMLLKKRFDHYSIRIRRKVRANLAKEAGEVELAVRGVGEHGMGLQQVLKIKVSSLFFTFK
jgi:hypothetical protein